MSLTKRELTIFTKVMYRDLATIPATITRAQALHLCDIYDIDAPRYERGNPEDEVRKIDLAVYITRRFEVAA